MQTNPNQTQMTNPPTSEVKMEKIRALQGIWINRLAKIVNPGEEFDATPEEIEEFCDKRFKGPYAFDGERSKKNAARHMYRRAITVSEARELEKRQKELDKLKNTKMVGDFPTIDGE